MEASKVILSEAEHRLISDVDVILTKNSSLEKIGMLFSRLSGIYQQNCLPLKDAWPSIFDTWPKISKGEKHHGLPWLMLDYPRCFDKQKGQLAIRTFFWWGNYFSIQLQVSGIYMMPFFEVLPQWSVNNNGWYKGFTDDAWDLQLPNQKWLDINFSSTNLMLNEDKVLKLAKKIPIDDWLNLEKIFTEDYAALVSLTTMALRRQDGEIIL